METQTEIHIWQCNLSEIKMNLDTDRENREKERETQTSDK